MSLLSLPFCSQQVTKNAIEEISTQLFPLVHSSSTHTHTHKGEPLYLPWPPFVTLPIVLHRLLAPINTTALRPPFHLSALTPRVTSDGPNLPSPQPLYLPPPRCPLTLVAVSTPHYKSDGSLSASHQVGGGSRLHADLQQSISLPRGQKEGGGKI